tara:strand:+ start:326 stop:676 length:351 start_codon:yes stop_codon:yes gene_type:complete
MTKKHFELVASLLSNIPGDDDRKHIASLAADRFAAGNPRFDRGRFIEACNAKSEYRDGRASSDQIVALLNRQLTTYAHRAVAHPEDIAARAKATHTSYIIDRITAHITIGRHIDGE